MSNKLGRPVVNNPRDTEMRELHSKGWAVTSLARKYNLTKPRVCQILKGRRVSKAEYVRNRRATAIEMLGGKCANCDCDDARVLEFHHKVRTKSTTYQNITAALNGDPNVELLCANCHTIETKKIYQEESE